MEDHRLPSMKRVVMLHLAKDYSVHRYFRRAVAIQFTLYLFLKLGQVEFDGYCFRFAEHAAHADARIKRVMLKFFDEGRHLFHL